MVHAHEILKLIGSSEVQFTKESLAVAVAERFGKDEKFTNCSGGEYDFNDIFQYFIKRSKIEIDTEGIIHLQLQNICG